jgi:hypothetical protein
MKKSQISTDPDQHLSKSLSLQGWAHIHEIVRTSNLCGRISNLSQQPGPLDRSRQISIGEDTAQGSDHGVRLEGIFQ